MHFKIVKPQWSWNVKVIKTGMNWFEQVEFNSGYNYVVIKKKKKSQSQRKKRKIKTTAEVLILTEHVLIISIEYSYCSQ